MQIFSAGKRLVMWGTWNSWPGSHSPTSRQDPERPVIVAGKRWSYLIWDFSAILLIL